MKESDMATPADKLYSGPPRDETSPNLQVVEGATEGAFFSAFTQKEPDLDRLSRLAGQQGVVDQLCVAILEESGLIEPVAIYEEFVNQRRNLLAKNELSEDEKEQLEKLEQRLSMRGGVISAIQKTYSYYRETYWDNYEEGTGLKNNRIFEELYLDPIMEEYEQCSLLSTVAALRKKFPRNTDQDKTIVEVDRIMRLLVREELTNSQ